MGLKDCEDHLDTCGYVHAQCKLKCGKLLQRNELKLHEEKCPLCIGTNREDMAIYKIDQISALQILFRVKDY